jgi:hypothetical protein
MIADPTFTTFPVTSRRGGLALYAFPSAGRTRPPTFTVAGPLPFSHRPYRSPSQRCGELIDEVLAVMRAPTRLRVRYEIQRHGGPVVMRRISTLTMAMCGCSTVSRLRAFLNGRLDLTQAEAVIDVIRSCRRRPVAWRCVNWMDGCPTLFISFMNWPICSHC